MSDKDIATSIMDHFDPAHYGISLSPMQRLGLRKHTAQTIAAFVDKIKKCFPNQGAETIRKALPLKNKIHVPRLSQMLLELSGINWFKRHTFIAIGPNKMWSLDQHDKFKHFGLFFMCHPLVQGTAQSIGGIPLITQSDPDWSVGFQNSLNKGVENKYYDIGDLLKCLVFHFVFIPFIQQEVDTWKPHKWKAADYKIPIPPEVLDEIEKKYASPDNPVLELVPPEFVVHANTIWTALGCPQP
ncbi:hypothetical protein EDB89DRAFT_1901967 [Lactarius sanguifluus]|nr:hypothetical protein EDB89DRAFT_1901967 [Lactarius sanguifluus]